MKGRDVVNDAICEPRSGIYVGNSRNIGVQPIELVAGFGCEDDAIGHRQSSVRTQTSRLPMDARTSSSAIPREGSAR